MNSSTHSTQPPAHPAGLAAVANELAVLAGQDPNSLTEAARAERILQLRRLVDRLQGHWLQELAVVDARGWPGPTRVSRLPRPLGGRGPGCG